MTSIHFLWLMNCHENKPFIGFEALIILTISFLKNINLHFDNTGWASRIQKSKIGNALKSENFLRTDMTFKGHVYWGISDKACSTGKYNVNVSKSEIGPKNFR